MNAPEPTLTQRNPLLETQSDEAGIDIGQPRQRSLSAPRVLFLINSLEGGGAERVFSTLVNSIQTHIGNADVSVLLLDNVPGRYEIGAQVNIHCLNSNGSLLDTATRFRRYVATHRPQLVVSFLPRANYVAAAFANAYGYRCIISERSDTRGRIPGGLSGWLQTQLVRVLYPRAHKVVAVAEGVRQGLVNDYRVSTQAACVIHNPFDLTRLNELAQEPSALLQDPRLQRGFIVAVGRLLTVKRFDVLIRAVAQGKFEQPLVILGEGQLHAELQSLAQSLGVADRVLFPGFLPNPYSVMAHASVFVLSSEREGFPNALVEAMALGRPVIASNCEHGPAEILDDAVKPRITGVHEGKYGLLVPTADAGALASALNQVLTDDTRGSALARRAVERAGHFTMAAAMARYADIINEQLALASKGRG